MRRGEDVRSLVALGFVMAGACDPGQIQAEPDGARLWDGDDAASARDAQSESAPSDVLVDSQCWDGDAEGGDGAGPVTFVMERAALIEDRLCDLDGDGRMDNAFADLGSPLSSILLASLTNALQSALEGGDRMVVHLPWVEDLRGLTDPEVVMILFNGTDLDTPPNPADDFSGSEPFRCRLSCLDECGEPRLLFRTGRLEGGTVEAADGSIAVPFGLADWLRMNGARATGTIDAGATGTQMDACGYVVLTDLGEDVVFSQAGDLTSLEVMLSGGATFGVPTVPGVELDLDLDGDGLERFTLDEDRHIETCVDGDETVIVGRDCWRDERMADGLSINLRVWAVAARFAGREPSWESAAALDCADPPEQSLWDAR